MSGSSQEVWVPIMGIPYGFYEVSSEGRVRSLARIVIRNDGRRKSLKEKILNAAPNANGYPSVVLSFNGVRRRAGSHQLLAEAFFGPRPARQEVRHLDGNRSDPRLRGDMGDIRLAYGTRSQNIEDAKRHGTFVCGEDSYHAKLSELQAREIIRSSLPDCDLARKYGVGDETIRAIRVNRTWRHLSRAERGIRVKKSLRGENGSRAILTEKDVIEIIHSSQSGSVLARNYAVSVATINAIRAGHIWKHVSRPARVKRPGNRFRGEDRPHAKLNEKQVIEILESSLSRSILAQKYSVSVPTISDIVFGRSWTHVPRPVAEVRP